MRRRRREAGFEPAGKIDLGGRGMPAPQARSMLLQHAWAAVAGPTLAPLVDAVDVQRGVLELRLATEDPGWRTTLAELVPQLAARVAHEQPALRVRRYRLRGTEDDDGRTHRLPAVEIGPPTGEPTGDETLPGDPRTVEERLRQAMEAYLAPR